LFDTKKENLSILFCVTPPGLPYFPIEKAQDTRQVKFKPETLSAEGRLLSRCQILYSNRLNLFFKNSLPFPDFKYFSCLRAEKPSSNSST
jgi:hypothetical protein